MLFRKYFAKAALKTDKTISDKGGTTGIMSLSVALLPLSLTIGGMTALMTETDSGNEYEAQIYQQYDEHLVTLEQAKKAYNKKYNSPLSEKEKQTANITKSIDNIRSSLFNFEDADDRDVKAKKELEQIIFFSGIFAKDMITDAKLSEKDAEILANRLETNVISFKELGYSSMPDTDDLRECQAISSNAKDITNCTIQSEYASSKEIFNGAGLGLLLGLILLPGVPLVARKGIKTHREKLENWSKGKKGNSPKH